MRIIINNPFEWFGKVGLSIEGRYSNDQIINLISDLLIHRGITAKIEIDKKTFKDINYFKNAEEIIDES